MADDPWSYNANKSKSCLNKGNDRDQHCQIMEHKAFSLCTLVQTLPRMVEKSCWKACQLLCCSIDKDNLLCDSLAICPGKKGQGHTEELHLAAAAEAWSPPSTILIVNISNSTLIDCVIGNETCAPTVAEKQPLMRETIQDLHVSSKCSCSPQNIQIDGSNLSCVIIGDNNYILQQVEQTVPSEEETGEDGSLGVQKQTNSDI